MEPTSSRRLALFQQRAQDAEMYAKAFIVNQADCSRVAAMKMLRGLAEDQGHSHVFVCPEQCRRTSSNVDFLARVLSEVWYSSNNDISHSPGGVCVGNALRDALADAVLAQGGHPGSAVKLMDDLIKKSKFDDRTKGQILQAFAIRRRFFANMGRFLTAFEPPAPVQSRPRKPPRASQRQYALEDGCQQASATHDSSHEQTDHYEEPASATHKSPDPPANATHSGTEDYDLMLLVLTARMSFSCCRWLYKIARAAVCV